MADVHCASLTYLAGLVESLALQIESLHDRLHVAQLQGLGPATLVLAPPEPGPLVGMDRRLLGAGGSGSRAGESWALRALQARVSELSAQNSVLKATAARLARGLSEAMGGGQCGGGGGVGIGTAGAAAVLEELSAAERILAELQE